MDGIYAGVPYTIERSGGTINLSIPDMYVNILKPQGAKMSILENIGDKDPEDVMEALFDSIPE